MKLVIVCFIVLFAITSQAHAGAFDMFGMGMNPANPLNHMNKSNPFYGNKDNRSERDDIGAHSVIQERLPKRLGMGDFKFLNRDKEDVAGGS
jgi:hypothetical protein